MAALLHSSAACSQLWKVKSRMEQTEQQTHEQAEIKKKDATQIRRNPRIVIGNLDYFDMLMEQDEEG